MGSIPAILVLLLQKPTNFIFRKKIITLSNDYAKYVKNFRLLKFVKLYRLNSINSSVFSSKLPLLGKAVVTELFSVRGLKKFRRLKSFNQLVTSSSLTSSLTNALGYKNITHLAFSWNKNNSGWLFTNSLSSTRLPLSLIHPEINTLNSNLFNNIKMYTKFQSHTPLWSSMIDSLYQINKLNAVSASLEQLIRYFYSNQFVSGAQPVHIFKSNHLSLINNFAKTPFPHLSLKNRISAKSTKSIRKNSHSRLLRFVQKYLPNVLLLRLFRYYNTRKPIHYDISYHNFFKTPLIRLGLNYHYRKINTLKHSTNISYDSRNNLYKVFFNQLSSDRFIENIYDSQLLLSKFFEISSNANSRTLAGQVIKHDTPSSHDWTLPHYKPHLNNISSLSLFSTDFLNINHLLQNPLLYKYFYWLSYIVDNKPINSKSFQTSFNSLQNHHFSSRINVFSRTNLWPSHFFHFVIKRKILKIFSFNKFVPNITMWYYNLLIRFFESCTGKRVLLKFNPFIENFLSFADIARCNMWSVRITSFQKLLGPKIFLNESLRIMHLALRFKDPTFFSNWIKAMLYRMSFWKYRLLFRYIKFAMRYLFWLHFSEFEFKGLKIKLKGKISVAGNARTRTLVYRIGETGYSKIENRIISESSTINTFTGVLGFKIWFFF